MSLLIFFPLFNFRNTLLVVTAAASICSKTSCTSTAQQSLVKAFALSSSKGKYSMLRTDKNHPAQLQCFREFASTSKSCDSKNNNNNCFDRPKSRVQSRSYSDEDSNRKDIKISKNIRNSMKETDSRSTPNMNIEQGASVHSAYIGEIHNVPIRVLIRPFPSVLDEEKVLSLMETIQVINFTVL